MAPEQLKRTHSVDHRADLYSLGVVFYEMLTGELPLGRFAPPSRKATLDQRLDEIVLRALAREPENRFQDAGDMKRAVEGIGSPANSAGSAQPQAVPAAAPWPSVHFTVHGEYTGGKKAQGLIHRDEEALIVEFEESGWFGKGEFKEVTIPLKEITALYLRRDWGDGSMVMVIKTARLRALWDLPSSYHGRGKLPIPREERDAALQLIDSIMPPAPEAAKGRDRAGMLSGVERARLDVSLLATGLLLTGVMALLCSIALGALSFSFAPKRIGHFGVFAKSAGDSIPPTPHAAVVSGGEGELAQALAPLEHLGKRNFEERLSDWSTFFGVLTPAIGVLAIIQIIAAKRQ
jgi:hypothetical protein